MRFTWIDVRAGWRAGKIDQLAFGAAVCAVPMSIAVSEIFLAVALVSRLARIVRGEEALVVPQVFWFWLVWAGLEVVGWLHSPEPGAGTGEMRHLLLIAALFVTVPSLEGVEARLRVWRLVLVSATLGSAALIAGFAARAIRYRHELAMGGDAAFYLRSGGLLHHWMVYATVEVLVFGALLEFRWTFPGERWWLTPALAIHCAAVLLSLTRSLWVACLVVYGLHLAWRRSKRLWAIPVLPAIVFLVPGPIHQRVTESLRPDYYSNAERVEMWRVGWRMIREHPVFGVGPGRVEELYTRYLRAGELVPAYHGHLHDNAIQLAAQFGVVTLLAAAVFLAMVVRELVRSCRRAGSTGVVSRSGLLGLAGFLTVGVVDYTYGHSLGLILAMFAVVGGGLALQDARAVQTFQKRTDGATQTEEIKRKWNGRWRA